MFEYIEAEESLISCLLVRGDAIEEIYGTLTADMFESGVLGKAYIEYQTAFDEKRELTIEELSQRMTAAGYEDYEINDVLARCISRDAMAFKIRSYANVILNHYKKRQIDKILGGLEIKDADVDDQIDKLMSEFDSLRGGKSDDGHTVAEITNIYQNDYFKDEDKAIISLDDEEIDGMTGGFQGGDMVLLGGRPASGKSALAVQWAERLARKGIKVAYYNCEMQERSVYERFVASKSGIEITRLRFAKAFLNDEEPRYRKAVDELSKQENLTIYTGARRVADIRKDVRENKFGIVFVDYLQLLLCENRYQGNRVAEVGEISRGLKQIAMDFNIALLCLTQLNRASEARQGKEPQLSDLRESGSLEQDASVVLLLYGYDEDDRSKKRLKVEKSRNGKTGSVDMVFDGSHLSFTPERQITPFD